jgi:membrane protein implicated in regulation of membrane protease activity
MAINWYSRKGWAVLAYLLLMAGFIILTLHYVALVLIAPTLPPFQMVPAVDFVVNSNLIVPLAVCMIILSAVIFLRND